MSINTDEHLGEALIALDISAGISPYLQKILPPDTDLQAVADDLDNQIKALIDAALPDAEKTAIKDNRIVRLHSRSGVITKTRREKLDELHEIFSRGREAQEDAMVKREAFLDNHPHNGEEGWWMVSCNDVRHEQTHFVRENSARGAIEKARNLAGDEFRGTFEPTVRFLGAEFPDGLMVDN